MVGRQPHNVDFYQIVAKKSLVKSLRQGGAPPNWPWASILLPPQL